MHTGPDAKFCPPCANMVSRGEAADQLCARCLRLYVSGPQSVTYYLKVYIGTNEVWKHPSLRNLDEDALAAKLLQIFRGARSVKMQRAESQFAYEMIVKGQS